MTVILDTRWDISLEATYRVAWRGENVRISDAAMQRITASRTSFLNLIENDPTVVIYGVTTSMGELASQRLTPEERDRHARLKPFPAATAFGDELPERVVRAIVLARLTNFIEGHAATTPRIAKAVAHMLDGGPMPRVAAAGQGGAGEILALYPLFAAAVDRLRSSGQGTRLADQRLPVWRCTDRRLRPGRTPPPQAGLEDLRAVDRGLPCAARAL